MAGAGSGGQAGAGQGGSSGSANGGMGGGGMGGGGMSGGGVSGGGVSGGGMSGGGMGGCAGADLDTDHEHCGTCEHACGIRQQCLDGYCASSPCDGICAGLTVTVVPKGNNEFRQDKVGTAAGCFEVVGYEPMTPSVQRIIGWEFHNGRVMQVNGVPVTPIADPGCQLDTIPERVGGFCVHVTADPAVDYSGFRFPYGVPAGTPSCAP
jgi:hypothetical protein